MTKKSQNKVFNLCSKRIKMARAGKDMNQLQLATAMSVDFGIDVNQYSISQIERGSRFVKDFELVAIAKILKVNPLWLLFGEDIPKEFL